MGSARIRLRSAARVALGTLAFCVLLTLSATMLAAMGPPDPKGISIPLGTLLVAFAVQFWAVQPLLGPPSPTGALDVRRHVRAARLALTVATIFQVYMMTGLPIPGSAAEWAVFLDWAVRALASVGAAILMHRSPRVAHAILAALSAYCALWVARVGYSVLEAQRTGLGGLLLGPAYAVAVTMILLLIASIWFAFWAFRRVYRELA